MDNRPVILAVFANTQDQYHQSLQDLSVEQKKIQDLFQLGNSPFLYVPLFEAKVEELWDYVQKYREQIVAFHFGGHADQEVITLQKKGKEGEDTSSLSLATLLGTCPNLQLVFLNACSTSAHVALLFKEGIDHFIGTGGSIPDDLAAIFAYEFYAGITQENQTSIEQAFLAAKSRVLQQNHDLGEKLTRDRLSEGEFSDLKEEAWGLYSRPEMPAENYLRTSKIGNKGLFLKWQGLLTALLFLVPVATGFYLDSLPKYNVPIQMKLQAKKLDFVAKGSSTFQVGESFLHLELSNFTEVQVPLDSLRIIDDLESQELFTPEFRSITLYGSEEISSSINLEGSSLEYLTWQDSGTVSLSLYEHHGPPGWFIQLDGTEVEGQLSYAEGMKMEGSYFSLIQENSIGMSPQKDFDWAQVHAYGPKDQLLPISFLGNKGPFILSMLFDLEKTFSLKQNFLTVSELSFISQDEKYQPISTLLGGELHFLDNKNIGYHSFSIKEGDFLFFEKIKDFQIHTLEITPKALILSGQGKVHQVRKEQSPQEASLNTENPSLFSWFWHNNRMLFFLTLVLPLLLGVLLLFYKNKQRD